MRENKMTTEEIIDTFAIRTSEDDEDNRLGFEYGFLSKADFTGYRSKK